jgi:uncharacterized protein
VDAIAAGLIKMTQDGPRLITSRCRACQVLSFPAHDSCPGCGKEHTDEQLLSGDGTLWTWTVQTFPPKGFPGNEFVPFGVGYVEVDGALRIQGRLTEADPAKLRIGMPMTLRVLDEPDGGLSYAFGPR